LTISKPHEDYRHTSVLLSESLEVLAPRAGGIYVDCTLGGGGHTAVLLEQSGPTGKVLAFDRDPIAIENARIKLENFIKSGRLILHRGVFSDIYSVLESYNLLGRVDGVLADIGVSSHHLDDPSRGFSFQSLGPLDMRMNQSMGQSVAELLASAAESDIADIIYKFGEEPKSRFIAKIICEHRDKRPLNSTKDLADLIASRVTWKKESRKHPATRTFQALRIFINQELSELERLLLDAPKVLAAGGVLAIITFHSLEDRLVKIGMQKLAGKNPSDRLPRDIVLTVHELSQRSSSCAELIRPFPILPSTNEVGKNPRSRSAKLRAIRLIKECL
jgi:16S rRNA (cytosine1402-N4)-methyltransferase